MSKPRKSKTPSVPAPYDPVFEATWLFLNKKEASGSDSEEPVAPPQFSLTKEFAVSAYLGFRLLFAQGKTDVTGHKQASYMCPKSERHVRWKPLIADTLRRALVEVWSHSAADCVDSGEIYEDIRNVHWKAHSFDTKTRYEFHKEPYTVGAADNCELHSAESKKAFAEFRERQLRSALNNDSSAKSPFDDFHFSVPLSVLMAQKRTHCQKCKRRVHLYCSNCLTPVPLLPIADECDTKRAAMVPSTEHSSAIASMAESKASRKRSLAEVLQTDDSSILREAADLEPRRKALKSSVDSSVSESKAMAVCRPLALPCLDGCLPVAVDIIRHPKERLKVCSSAHACVLAPTKVTMYTWPQIPDYSKQSGVFLLFPSDSAQFMDVIAADESKRVTVKKVVVIENKWSGNVPIIERLSTLPHLKIRQRDTLYWRFQEKSRKHLSTIEAIYYAMVDLSPETADKLKLDDLLLLFAHNHERVRRNVNEGNTPPKVWIQ